MTLSQIIGTKEEIDYKFEAGEKVLCFHGPLIYEAKCQQVRICDDTNQPEYLIHYFGWSKNWDEWVAENRILKFNETNVKKQQELGKALSKVKERNKVKRKGCSTESKESKNSESGSIQSSSSNSQSSEASQPKLSSINEKSSDNSFVQNEEPEDRENYERNLSSSDLNLDNENGIINEISSQDVEGKDDSVCASTGDNHVSVGKEPNKIAQRRSSRMSLESRTLSSQDLEIKVEDENDAVLSSEDQFSQKGSEKKLDTTKTERRENRMQMDAGCKEFSIKLNVLGNEQANKSTNASLKVDRRKSLSALAENVPCTLDSPLDKPKRSYSVDTRKETADGTSQNIVNDLTEKIGPLLKKVVIVDAKRIIQKPKPPISPQNGPLFKISNFLRTYLTDDWDFVCRKHKLCKLPAKHPVETIVQTFIQIYSFQLDMDQEKAKEFMDLLIKYFNTALGHQLLHKFERPQYSHILSIHSDLKMSQIYGGPHLLRLLFQLHKIDSWEDLSKSEHMALSKVLQLFLKFLEDMKNVYFSSKVYFYAPIDYHREDSR